MLGWVSDTTRNFLGEEDKAAPRASSECQGPPPMLWGPGWHGTGQGLLPVSLHPPQWGREAQQHLGLVEEGIRTLGPGHGAMKQTQ